MRGGTIYRSKDMCVTYTYWNDKILKMITHMSQMSHVELLLTQKITLYLLSIS